MNRRTVLIALNAVGCVLSILLLLSGILWYPFMALILATLGAPIAVVVLGIWLGSYGRWQAPLSLAAGNAAVLIGFGCYAIAWELLTYSAAFLPAFYAGTLLMLFGYALIAGGLARTVLRATRRLA